MGLNGCTYDFRRDMQPSEAMASRRGQIDRAQGVEGGSCSSPPVGAIMNINKLSEVSEKASEGR